jgi:hypothetical protein
MKAARILITVILIAACNGFTSSLHASSLKGDDVQMGRIAGW